MNNRANDAARDAPDALRSFWERKLPRTGRSAKSCDGADTRNQRGVLSHYRRAAEVATKPFIYLSAGVGNAQFVESLHMATEAGTDYSGVLCGRATWKEGMGITPSRA